MKITITLDENGKILADSDIEAYVGALLDKGQDVHVANVLAINYIRARFHSMSPQVRAVFLPFVKWVFYGKEVHFDKDLRSNDAWEHPLTNLTEKYLMELL